MADPDNKASPAHLEASELGSKAYWDALYAQELANHDGDADDTGTVWFAESGAERAMASLLRSRSRRSAVGKNNDQQLQLDRRTAAVLDLGCGNGSLLQVLRRAGWAGPLLGVDYSEASVDLARRVTEQRLSAEDEDTEDEEEEEEEPEEEEGDDGGSRGAQPILFAVWDVLHGALDAVAPHRPALEPGDGGWDVVLDKGTFDAICLSTERDTAGRHVCEGYRARILALLRPGGCFVITSCNWTEDELRAWFERDAADRGRDAVDCWLGLADRADYPTISFGGVKGQAVSTLCFEKRVRR